VTPEDNDANNNPQPAAATGLPESDPTEKPFTPETLDRTVIAIPLLDEIKKNPDKIQGIVIDVNLEYPGGREKARENIYKWIEKLSEEERITRALIEPRASTASNISSDDSPAATSEP
jgi:hypothetical protein